MNAIIAEHLRDAAARRKLKHSRVLASGLLLLAAVLFVLAALYQPRYPPLGYLKAFSEAAMVGALADWFAVTALFRRPLGLPIPHTAILPRKQDRIADELGRFVERNFLHGKSIALRVYQRHPARQILHWLVRPQNRRLWLPWLTAQIPVALRTIPPAQMAQLGRRILAEHGSGRKLGEALAEVLALLRQHGLDALLLRAVLQQIHHGLHHESTRVWLQQSLLVWAGKIERDAPNSWDKIKASFKSTLAGKIDDWVAAKVLDWAGDYLAAALADEQHALWSIYARRLDVLAVRLRRSRAWHRRLEAGRQQWIRSEKGWQILAHGWQQVCLWSEADVQQESSGWQAQLEKLLLRLSAHAERHPQLLRRADARLAWWVRQVVERYKGQGARFVADKVRAWDSRQMVDKLELSVGRDLQFIRINGTLVGGLAGLAIYAVAQWLL